MRMNAYMNGGWRALALAAVLATGCGDDGVAVTDGGTASGTSSGTDTTDTTPTTTDTTPTTTEPTTTIPTTTDGSSTGTSTTDSSSTTSPVTSSTTGTDTDTTGGTETTGDTTGGTGTTGETTGDTDTTGGSELMGRSVSQTVNGGTVAKSTNFRMVFTIGQPTQNQGTYTSDNFRLQGGLIGANGSPP